jgi:hypothetical protein
MSELPAPAADVRAGFFRLPKVLFLDERYRGISAESKLLYALMLDRMGLSIRNGWADKAGRVFIYFTLEEIRRLLGCGHGKATGLCRELEDAALIERGPQVKKGRPQPIYVRDFACVYGKPAATGPEKTPEKPEPADSPDAGNRQREPETAELSPRFQQTFPQKLDGGGKSAPPMPESGGADAESRPHGCRKPAASNTDFNKTNLSNTNPSIVPFPRGMPALSDGMDRREALETIHENISYDILLQKLPDDKSRIDGIVSLLTDTVCSRRPTIRISGEEIPTEEVRERLFSLDDGHIEYVFDCMDESTVPIGNIRAYLLTALYNAPLTIDSYYDAKVRRDMALESEKRENVWTA